MCFCRALGGFCFRRDSCVATVGFEASTSRFGKPNHFGDLEVKFLRSIFQSYSLVVLRYGYFSLSFWVWSSASYLSELIFERCKGRVSRPISPA